MKTIKEIKGLKCPSHNYIKDNQNFTYESIGAIKPNSGTRCIKCGYTMSLHRPQR